MRVLLIAYEFPPSPSPQALRWTQLTRALVAQGAEVHVLTADMPWAEAGLTVPEGVYVYRTSAGGISRLIMLSRRWRRLRGRAEIDPPVTPAGPPPPSGEAPDGGHVPGAAPVPPPLALNWKGRLLGWVNRRLAAVTFPDERGRWEPGARRRLLSLLRELRPDVVVSSHEPATTLRLGRLARQAGFAWVADLGDPVLSFYTPPRWRAESQRIERWTCQHASHVTVTTEAAKWLLAGRHQVPGERISVLTQGFDAGLVTPALAAETFAPDRLELLYTGSFYQFREPRALVDAVLARDDVRLTIATIRPPDWLPALALAHPRQLRVLGFMPHAQAVALQRGADVLVNIANADPVHVPGKVYEYLGAGRPILHLGDDDEDAAARLVHTLRRGLVCGQGVPAIGEALAHLAGLHACRGWAQAFDLGDQAVARYAWPAIGARLAGILARVTGPAPARAGKAPSAVGPMGPGRDAG